MRRSWRIGLPLTAMVLALGCTPLAEPPGPGGDTIETETLPSLTSVPRAWGQLVSVTNGPENWSPGAVLWFQDEVGTIRLVYYDYIHRRFSEASGVIRR